MRNQLSIVFIFLASLCHAQVSKVIKNQKAILAAEQCIISIVGKEIFHNYFKFDTLDSYSFSPMMYGGNDKNGGALGKQECFNAVFYVIKDEDTVGYVSMYINEDNKPLNDWHEPASSGRPELLLAFKKLLNNEFKIDYKEAIRLGLRKGFATPILNAETEYAYKEIDGEQYIKVKYFWTFIQRETGKPNGILSINAETGIIETEKYYSNPN